MQIRIGNFEDIGFLLSKYERLQGVMWNQDQSAYIVIAEEGDEIIGFAFVFRRLIPAPIGECYEDFINVIEVFSTPNRNKGIGSALVQKCIEQAAINNSCQVRAYCDIHNVPSHKLWMKNRFGISPVKMPDGTIAGSFVTYRI